MKFVIFVVCTIAGVLAHDVLPECPEDPANNRLARMVVNGMEAVRPVLETGIPSKGIPPVDPLKLPQNIPIAISNEFLTLDGFVDDTTVYNLAKYIICELTIKIGLRPKFAMDVRMDDLKINGTYNIDGTYGSEASPVFGQGDYSLDVLGASFVSSASIKYSLLFDRLSIKNLEIDLLFEELKLYFECIMGCENADAVNENLSEIATEVFDRVWEKLQPVLVAALENTVNAILKDINASDLIPPMQLRRMIEEE